MSMKYIACLGMRIMVISIIKFAFSANFLPFLKLHNVFLLGTRYLLRLYLLNNLIIGLLRMYVC